MPAKKTQKRKMRPEIVVAAIGLVGVLGAAIITNFDKWFLKSVSENKNAVVMNNANSNVPALANAEDINANHNNQKDRAKPEEPSRRIQRKSVPSYSDQSTEELISILEIRAKNIIRIIDRDIANVKAIRKEHQNYKLKPLHQ
jgi:hypothetical protein